MLKKKYHNHIASTHKSKIIVHDRDQLLQTYPALQKYLRDQRYDLFFAKTQLDLRIIYEKQIRDKSGRYIITIDQRDLPLPDILKETYYCEVGFSKFFPNLDTDVLKGLSYKELDLLLQKPNYESKSRSQSIKFVLEHLYNIDVDSLIASESLSHWLGALLGLYNQKASINKAVNTFFKRSIESIDEQLNDIISSKAELMNYLQKEWKKFVKEGRSKVDFDHKLLKKEINHLFLIGDLNPVEISQAKEPEFEFTLGVYVDKNAAIKENISSLLDEVQTKLDVGFETVFDWVAFFPLVARLKYLSLELSEEEISQKVLELEKHVNDEFQKFVEHGFQSLFTLSGKDHPATVTRILDYISGTEYEKKALIVIDGLNLWQWNVVKQEIELEKSEDQVSLAWIPTITKWSRQAIFRGDKPDLSEDNSKEEKFFKEYWSREGLQNYQVGFHRINTNKDEIEDIDFSRKVLGFVSNDIDDLMHGATMGNEQFLLNTKQWAENKWLKKLLAKLKTEGYRIWITADHGNIEATGNGNLPRKTSKFTESKGKRHVHFDNEDLKKAFLAEGRDEYDFAEMNNSLYLKDTTAFALEGEQLVTHGGSHFWEVAVPFIEI